MQIDSLYARYAAGDPSYLDDLLDAGRRIALAVARRMNAADPADVAQQATIKAWQSIRAYDPERASFSTWIGSMTRRIVIDTYRATPPIAEIFDEVTYAGSSEIDYVTLDTRPLTDEERQTLAVFTLDPDFTSAAVTLGVTVATLKKRLQRIAAKARKRSPENKYANPVPVLPGVSV